MVFSLFFFFFFWDEHFYRLWFCTITFQMSGHQCSQVPVASHSFRFCYLFILKYSWEMWEFYQGSQKSWVNVRHCWSFKKKIKKIKSHGKYLTIYYVFGYRLFCWKMKKKKKYIYIFQLLFIHKITVHWHVCTIHGTWTMQQALDLKKKDGRRRHVPQKCNPNIALG